MTARASVENDFVRDGVRIALSPRHEEAVVWGDAAIPTVTSLEPGMALPEDAWLRMPEDLARALYEALADHFGHSGHDARALRRDYDAERSRVDRLIGHLTGGKP